MFAHMKEALTANGFFNPDNPKRPVPALATFVQLDAS